MMMDDGHRDVLRSKGTLIARVLMGFLFFASGLNIVLNQGIGNTASYFDAVGVPLAGLAVYIVIVWKLAAGGALMFGYRTGLAAAALILFTFLATYFGHWDLEDPGLFKNLALIGGLIYMMAYGPGGGWSLDKGGKMPMVKQESAEPQMNQGEI